MSYLVGQSYRYIAGLDKRGKPVYEASVVKQVSATKIYLENGKNIEFEDAGKPAG